MRILQRHTASASYYISGISSDTNMKEDHPLYQAFRANCPRAEELLLRQLCR